MEWFVGLQKPTSHPTRVPKKKARNILDEASNQEAKKLTAARRHAREAKAALEELAS